MRAVTRLLATLSPAALVVTGLAVPPAVAYGEDLPCLRVRAVSAGQAHSLAVWDMPSDPAGLVSHRATGHLAWGLNYSGQLGDGTRDNADRAVFGELWRPSALAAGWRHSLGVAPDGTVWAWGDNWWGQLGNGTVWTTRPSPVGTGLGGAVAVAAADDFSVALTSDGGVHAWGANHYGQLGNGTTDWTTNGSSRPKRVPGLPAIRAIAATTNHVLALDLSGQVWAWGANWWGAVGDGTTADRLSPVRLTGLPPMTAIAAGYAHSLALDVTGQLWAWGGNGSGQLGVGDLVDRLVPTKLTTVPMAAIAAGGEHSLAVDVEGRVWAWGGNSRGQLGFVSAGVVSEPAQQPTLRAVTAVAAGLTHSLAIGAAGIVWAWGEGSDGRLGYGGSDSRTEPAYVVNCTRVDRAR